MRKVLIISVSLIFAMLVSSAQAQWAKAYAGAHDENPTQALLTEEGDLLVAGFNKRISGGLEDVNFPDPDAFNLFHSPWLTRISASGAEAENRVLESSREGENPDGEISDEWARSLVPTEDGGYILAGHMEKSWFDGDTSKEYNCAFLIKVTHDFQIEWQRVLGNDERTTSEKLLAVSPTMDGAYIAVGSTSSFGAGKSDFLVMKFDSQGQIIWQKAYGGTGDESAGLVSQTPDGGFLVVGHTTSFQPEEETAQEIDPVSRIWILRLNPDGAVVWQNMYMQANDVASALAASPDGVYWILGTTEIDRGEGTDPDKDILIFKLDDSGDLMTQRSFGDETDEWISHAVWTEENKLLAVGTQSTEGNEDILVVQFADTGHIDWMGVFGDGEVEGEVSQETGAVVIPAEKQEILVVGRTSRLGSEKDDLLVLRLTAEGRIPNCDLMRSQSRYHFADRGTLPMATSVEFLAAEIVPLNIVFSPIGSPAGLIRDVCVAKKNLLRR
jgi:hypothetical protein